MHFEIWSCFRSQTPVHILMIRLESCLGTLKCRNPCPRRPRRVFLPGPVVKIQRVFSLALAKSGENLWVT